MPDEQTITHVRDAMGEFWIYPDGRVTVFTGDGRVILSDPDGAGHEVSPDGSIQAVSKDGVITHQFPGGTKYTWSDRDQQWIRLNPALDGSRWERDPGTNDFVEMATPSRERPQMLWASPDGRTEVTEVNGNLFRVHDGEHSIRYNHTVPETGPLAGQWQPVTPQAWASVKASNQGVEAEHRDPEAVANQALSDALMQMTATHMHWYVEIMMKIGSYTGGPVGKAADWAWDKLKVQEELKRATGLQERLKIIAEAMEPQGPSGRGMPHPHSGKPDPPGAPAPKGVAPVPDDPHAPKAGSADPAAAKPPTSAADPRVADQGPEAAGNTPADGPGVPHGPGAPATPTSQAAPADPVPGSGTPAPKPATAAVTPDPPAAPADRGISADPFAPKPLSTAKDDPVPGAIPADPPVPGMTTLPPGTPVKRLDPVPETPDGTTVNVKPQQGPDGLDVRDTPNPRTSASTQPYERLEASLGDPPGSREDWSPHHIIPTKEGGTALDGLRLRMKEAGIDPDDAANGVWLPKNEQVPNPTGALAHSTWVHAGRADPKDPTAPTRADYSYTIYKRCEGKHGQALRDEIAAMKGELSGASNQAFKFYTAPPGWKDVDRADDLGHGTNGGPGQGGQGPGGGAAATPNQKPTTTAPGSDPQPGPGKHAAATDPQPQPTAADRQLQHAAADPQLQPRPAAGAGPQSEPGPQVIAGIGAGVDAAADRGAISQDGASPPPTLQGPGGDAHHSEVTAPGGQDPAHPGGHAPGAPHPAAVPAGDTPGTAPGHTPGQPGYTPHGDHGPAHQQVGAGIPHGVGTPDQLHPAGSLDGSGAPAGGEGEPAAHAVGLPDDAIGHLAADPHAGVGLPGTATQDPHTTGSPNPNNPQHDKNTDEALHPGLHPDQHPVHHPAPPKPLPDHHPPPPPPHHEPIAPPQPPPEQPVVVVVEAGGSA